MYYIWKQSPSQVQETNDGLHKILFEKLWQSSMCHISYAAHHQPFLSPFFFSSSLRIPTSSPLLTISLSYTFPPGLVFMNQHKCVSIWCQICLTTFSVFFFSCPVWEKAKTNECLDHLRILSPLPLLPPHPVSLMMICYIPMMEWNCQVQRF